ncbi:hypothetical protein ABE28_019845 [Peribacillus muralis]|uniref:Uncharacterized protein n=1 Tax=Peribacillus muralis TaxID=264697 RepID=A0A1B3XTT1_9BACI|nr:hypothetical protein ABE28_019845 [Peribacillus muralis]
MDKPIIKSVATTRVEARSPGQLQPKLYNPQAICTNRSEPSPIHKCSPAIHGGRPQFTSPQKNKKKRQWYHLLSFTWTHSIGNKNQSTKKAKYRRNGNYIDEKRNISPNRELYLRKRQYIDENRIISTKTGHISAKRELYRRKPAKYRRTWNYICENGNITPKTGIISAKTAIYRRTWNYIDEKQNYRCKLPKADCVC